MIIDLVIDWSTIEIINPLVVAFLLIMLGCVVYSVGSCIIEIAGALISEYRNQGEW